MGTIRLYPDAASGQTLVSNPFIEQLMPQANGEFVKIYIYLLYCIQHHPGECSVSDAADLLNRTDNDVIRALRYWEKKNALRLELNEDGSIAGIRLLPLQAAPDTAPQPVPVREEHTAAPETVALRTDTRSENTVPSGPDTRLASSDTGISSAGQQAQPIAPSSPAQAMIQAVTGRMPEVLRETGSAQEPKQYTAQELREFSQDPNIMELLFIIQTYLKHPLNDTEVNTILFWYDELKFPTDLIEYLTEYCISKGHSSLRYMNKVAMNWKQEGICDVGSARENAAIHNQIYYAVMKSLGIHGRSLVPSETEYLRKWTADYGFGTELICEACRRTITATHQSSFEYTDSILTRWLKSQVKTLEDIARLDEEHLRRKKASGESSAASDVSRPVRKNAFTDFSQRTYNEEELERMLLHHTAE